jgi:hypothetical protein
MWRTTAHFLLFCWFELLDKQVEIKNTSFVMDGSHEMFDAVVGKWTESTLLYGNGWMSK